MEDIIIVDYDPFLADSKVIISRGDNIERAKVSSNLADLPSELVAIAYNNHIYNVKTRAPLAVTSEIKRLVNEIESKNYSENKITVRGF